MKFQDWIKTHQNEALVGGAGIALTLYIYMKSKGSTTTSTAATQSGYPTVLASTVAGAPTTRGYSIPTGIVQVGSGFMVPGQAGLIEDDSGGSEYEHIATPAQVKQLESGGVEVDYQPSPGVFKSVKGMKLLKGTPQFTRVTA